jgi:amino acid permease
MKIASHFVHVDLYFTIRFPTVYLKFLVLSVCQRSKEHDPIYIFQTSRSMISLTFQILVGFLVYIKIYSLKVIYSTYVENYFFIAVEFLSIL